MGVTVMDLLMEVLMMVMLAVKEILSVAATTVRSLVFISMRRMIAVTCHLLYPLTGQHLLLFQGFLLNLPQVSGAEVVTMMVGDAVLQRILAMKERETVTELVMEVLMMETEDVVETLCVAVTTARSLVPTTMTRMTAVREQRREGLDSSI